MYEDDEIQEKRRGPQIAWWVRYAFVPIIVAIIAGYSVVKAAEMAYQPPQEPPSATTPAPVVPTATAQTPPTSAPTQPAPTQPAPTPVPTFTQVPTLLPTATQIPTLAPTPVSLDIGRHVVRPGEYLYCIGRAYGVDPYAIARVNRVGRAGYLLVGQVLIIPAVQWQHWPPGEVCSRQFASPYPVAVPVIQVPPRVRPPIFVPPAVIDPGFPVMPPGPAIEFNPTPAPVIDPPSPVVSPVDSDPPIEGLIVPDLPVEINTTFPPLYLYVR